MKKMVLALCVFLGSSAFAANCADYLTSADIILGKMTTVKTDFFVFPGKDTKLDKQKSLSNMAGWSGYSY